MDAVLRFDSKRHVCIKARKLVVNILDYSLCEYQLSTLADLYFKIK